MITDNALCIDCGLCEIHCPEFAISVEHDAEPDSKEVAEVGTR